MALPKYSGKELTKHLRLLAMEAEGLSPDGDTETKAQALARLIWKRALGYTDIRRTEKGTVEVNCPPEVWAIQLVYERLEGKVANTAPEESGKLSAAERVSDLSKARINGLSIGGHANPIEALAAHKPLPPKLPKKGK